MIVSAGRATIDDSTDHDSIGKGAVIVNIVEGRLLEDEFDDTVAAIGFTLGRRIGQWNLQLETLWRYRTDWDLTAATHQSGLLPTYSPTLRLPACFSIMVRQGPIRQRWPWLLGAGTGVLRNELKVPSSEVVSTSLCHSGAAI